MLTRDLALIAVAIVAIVAATILIATSHAAASIAPIVGLGSFALGRLGPPTSNKEG